MPELYTYPSIRYRPPSNTDCRPSATWNHQAHDKWASKYVSALEAVHEYAPPTHWATIKMNRQMLSHDIRHFLKTITKAVEYQNSHDGRHLAIFAVPEIDAGECVHFHVLIRATTIDPGIFFVNIVQRYNAKYGTEITFPYIERPQSASAISVYTLKLGDHDILLFQSGSLSRYTFQAGRYFMGQKVKDLRGHSRDEWLLTRAELAVDEVVGYWEPPAEQVQEAATMPRKAWPQYRPRYLLIHRVWSSWLEFVRWLVQQPRAP